MVSGRSLPAGCARRNRLGSATRQGGGPEGAVTAAGAAKALLLDDREDGLFALERVLHPLGCSLVCASSGEEALKTVLREDIAVLLLDGGHAQPGRPGGHPLPALRGPDPGTPSPCSSPHWTATLTAPGAAAAAARWTTSPNPSTRGEWKYAPKRPSSTTLAPTSVSCVGASANWNTRPPRPIARHRTEP